MQLHELPCLICGKQLHLMIKGKDDPATYPCVVGGIFTIDFGYGSSYDGIDGQAVHQGLVCDPCFCKVSKRTRTMIQTRHVKWEKS